jgi:hypothetical protein
VATQWKVPAAAAVKELDVAVWVAGSSGLVERNTCMVQAASE